MTAYAPTAEAQRTKNPLRPSTFDEIVGQDDAKRLMRRAIAYCFRTLSPMPHTLLVAASGTGKSTFSHALANELGVSVYSIEAPVDAETLAQLREVMFDGDILMIEEIHMQAVVDRRGRGNTAPEVLYLVMEDRVLQTATGPLPYPNIAILGTTTDEGRLPDAFINRFPLRPVLKPYTLEQLRAIVRHNAGVLDVDLTDEAIDVFAGASRRIPREVNNLVRNAALLCEPGAPMTREEAIGVLDINGITVDGLTRDMQSTLIFLYTKAKRVGADGVRYQAGISTIATAIGKSRDSQAIVLRVEPHLIFCGFLQVAHGGRMLTDAGVARAQRLIHDGQ